MQVTIKSLLSSSLATFSHLFFDTVSVVSGSTVLHQHWPQHLLHGDGAVHHVYGVAHGVLCHGVHET